MLRSMTRTIAGFAPGASLIDGQDLQLDENGNLLIVEGLEDVRQRVLFRLRFWLGQWFLAVQDGVPYRPEIFQRPTSVGLAAAVVSDKIRSLDEVTGVANVFASIDPLLRRMTYQCTVQTPHGDMDLEETVGS